MLIAGSSFAASSPELHVLHYFLEIILAQSPTIGASDTNTVSLEMPIKHQYDKPDPEKWEKCIEELMLGENEPVSVLETRRASNGQELQIIRELLVFYSAILHDDEDAYFLDARYSAGACLKEFVASARPTLEFLATKSKTVDNRAKACDLLWAGLPPSKEKAEFGDQAVGLLVSAGSEHPSSSAEPSERLKLLLRAFRVAQSVKRGPSAASELVLDRLVAFFGEALNGGAYVVCSKLLEGAVKRGAPRPFLERLWMIASANSQGTEAYILEELARRLQKTDELLQLVEARLTRQLEKLLQNEETGGEPFGLSIQYEALAEKAQSEGCGNIERAALAGYQRTSNAAFDAAPLVPIIPDETILPRLHTLVGQIDAATSHELCSVFLSSAAFITRERAAEALGEMKTANPLLSATALLPANSDGRRRSRSKEQELGRAMFRLKLDMEKHGAVLLQFLMATRIRSDWNPEGFVDNLVSRAPNLEIRKDLLRRALRSYFRLDFTGALAFGIPVFEALLRDEVVGRGQPALSVKASGVMDDTMGALLTELERNPGTLDAAFIFTARILLAEPQGPNLRNDHCHGNLANYTTPFCAYFGWLLCKFLAGETSWSAAKKL